MADNSNASYVVIANLLVAVGVFAFLYVGQQMSHVSHVTIVTVANEAPKVTLISTAVVARQAP